ncbi:MAG: Lin0512 family protein [Pseudomonadota bacterium]
MGSSLRQMDYTQACIRALKDALWHNSLTMADAFGFPKSAMIVDIEVACQEPDAVDLDAVKAVLPYGQGSVKATKGGLDIPAPHRTGHTVIAHAAVKVSFDMERAS